jgi:hypothetical protein
MLLRADMLLADLQNCTLGYSPTEWQRSRFPAEYQYKLETIFDGIDTTVWHPLPGLPRDGADPGRRAVEGTGMVVRVGTWAAA